MGHFPTRILLATDGSEDASRALHAAVDLSSRTASELHVVHAWQALPEYSHPSIALASDSALYEREAQRILFEQLDAVETAGGVATGAHLRRGRAVEVITDLSEELEAGLVVVGSRGLGPVGRLVMGSVSEGVVDLASRPVLVVRGGGEAWPPGCIVVGEDGSGGAREASELAAGIGSVFGAEVILVRAHPVILPMDEASRLSRASPIGIPQDVRAHHEGALMERAYRLQEELGYRPRIRVIGGEPASVLLEVAEERGGASLICVGRRGLGMMDRLRLGSVSTKVLRAARGPVLVCPS
ncbi:MAG TPA: universal stress protein [Rubrobacteraceae bacterium]|nr:universal stress protein [Rubrobacteraceae bacterium]